jgi:hypothetical protein
MKVSSRSGNRERELVIGLIVSRQVLAHLSRHWTGDLFDSEWSNLIAGWCVKYYQQHGDAPNRYIDTLYSDWAERTKDKDTVKLIDSFLTSLGGEYKRLGREVNADLLIDRMRIFFDKVRLRRLYEQIGESLEDGAAEKGWELVHTTRPVPMGGKEWVSVLEDEDAVDAAFDNQYESIIHYGPKNLREFFGARLRRGGFVAFVGMDKVGKSWWLIDLAWRAMEDNRKVAFFAIGDMTKNDMMMRFGCRAAGRPIKAGKYRVPKKFNPNGSDEPICIYHRTSTVYEDMTKQEAKGYIASYREGEGDRLRMVVSPAGEMSVPGIASQLGEWSSTEGWDADVVVIDYADLLASTHNGRMETRDQINEDWIGMRAISQRNHCLVVTATQADAGAYTTRLLRRENFSNDKRKNAHVTAMIGINQDDEEQEHQVQRLNYIVDREGAMSIKRVCYVAGCLSIGNPALGSYMPLQDSE